MHKRDRQEKGVRLSATTRYCVKKAEPIVEILSPLIAPAF